MTNIHDPHSLYHVTRHDLDARRNEFALERSLERVRTQWTTPVFLGAAASFVGGASALLVATFW